MKRRVADPKRQPRPFIGVQFTCCGAYARFYRRPEERFYRGRCPRCMAVLHVAVAEHGSSSNLLKASCR